MIAEGSLALRKPELNEGSILEGSWVGSRRSGARKSRKQAEPRPMDHNLKTPKAVAGEGVKSLAPSSLDCRSKLEEAKMQLILDKLAEGTQKHLLGGLEVVVPLLQGAGHRGLQDGE